MKATVAVLAGCALLTCTSVHAAPSNDQTRKLFALCTADDPASKDFCETILTGFKMGFNAGTWNGVSRYKKDEGSKLYMQYAECTDKIKFTDFVDQWAKVLLEHPKLRSANPELSLMYSLVTLCKEV